jgi:hypothetical protein
MDRINACAISCGEAVLRGSVTRTGSGAGVLVAAQPEDSASAVGANSSAQKFEGSVALCGEALGATKRAGVIAGEAKGAGLTSSITLF